MEGGDHAANERVNMILFGYLLSLKQDFKIPVCDWCQIVCKPLYVRSFTYSIIWDLDAKCTMLGRSHVVYEWIERSRFDYSLSLEHVCEAWISSRNKIANEGVHQAIFRYMFPKKQKRGQDDGGYRARCQWTSQRDSVRLHTTQLRIKSSNLPCSTKAK